MISNEDLISYFETVVEQLAIYEQDILTHGDSDLQLGELSALYAHFKSELVKRLNQKQIDKQ